jgi:hypothetical protein
MDNLELLLKIFLVTWILTNHDKISELVDTAYIKIKSKFSKKFLLIILNNLHEVLTCHKCLSFFTTLFITQDIFAAILVSFVASIFQKNNF